MNETEIVKQFYAALNNNDIEAVLKLFDSQVLRVEHFQTTGTFHGLEGMRKNMQGRSNWAEGACEPESLKVAGHIVIVDAHVHVRLKNQTEWINGHVTDIFAIKNGKITEFHSFFDNQKALAWVESQTKG